MLDIKAWLEPHLNVISKHTAQHHFKFSKRSKEIIVEYKLHQAEEWLKQDVTYLNKMPKGKPNFLKPDYFKIDFVRLQKLIHSITFMLSDVSKRQWWDRFLKQKQLIKDTGEKKWIDVLPKQEIVVNEVDTSSAIPEAVKRMIEKETQPVKVVSKARKYQNKQKKPKAPVSQQKRKPGKKMTVISITRCLLIPIERDMKRQIWLQIFRDLLEFLFSTTYLLVMTLLILVKYLHLFAVYDILLLLNDIWIAVLNSHLGVISKASLDNTSFYISHLSVVS